MPGPSSCSRLVVAAAVLDSLGSPTEMLCAARSYPPGLAGRFELPGGKVEPGEAPVAALARELAEEVSLTVRLGPELVPPGTPAVGSGPGGGAGSSAGVPAAAEAPAWPVSDRLRMRVWLAEPARPGDRGRRGADHQELRWVDLEEAVCLPWLDPDVPVIAALLTRLRGT